MNYQQTIDYLYHKLPLFSRVGSAALKNNLNNIHILCNALGNPQNSFKTIHVGGTNGKGSVSHMLAAILQTAGCKTGLHTSPHLYDFRERIKINGTMVDENFVVDFTQKIKPLIEDIQPSFFEITVAMAFQYFAEQETDVAVIEVGLGGRLDSTNIINPLLSVITNIGWDHTNLLGNTLPEIATEKAGIIKPNVPVVIGEKNDETDAVFIKQAQLQTSTIYFAEERFVVNSYNLQTAEISIEINDEHTNKQTNYSISLPGLYQTKNLPTVLQSVELLKEDFIITYEHTAIGLKNVQALTGLYGRWQVIHQNPDVVLEVAHNKNGMEEMLRHLQQLHFQNLHIVFGVVKDKDLDGILALLPREAAYYFTAAKIPRALPATDLQTAAAAFLLAGKVYNNVNEALHSAILSAAENDLIIVCGSIFLVAEVNKDLILHKS